MEIIEDSFIKCSYNSDNIPIKITYYNKNKEEKVYEYNKPLAEDYISRTYLFENEGKEKIAVKLIKKLRVINNRQIIEMIEIQKSINRPDFSKFINKFEDENYIFIILEYYLNDSLYNLVKKEVILLKKKFKII